MESQPSAEQARVYAERRARVMASLGDDAALILGAAPELRVGDTELRYAPDPDIYYLTGFTEPDTVLVLCPANAKAPFTFFVRGRDESQERWTGTRAGPAGAVDVFAADAAYDVGQLNRRLPKLLARTRRVFARLGDGRTRLDGAVIAIVAQARNTRRRTGKGPHTIVDPGLILDDMRLIKDDLEIAALRRAANITVESFRDAARVIERGAGEWVVEAAIDSGFRARGASGPAFPTIVASGANATVLHYVGNRREMRSGELVLIDAGARADMYCADVTRTYAVSRRATREQRAMHNAVRAAHAAAVAAVRPGAPADAPHEAALDVLLDAIHDIGLVKGDRATLRRRHKTWRPFLPHKTTHWLGLDVHDVGDMVRDGKPRPLEPGMVFTIEPGLYIPEGTKAGPESLRGMGIRIEDDVLVTADGCEVLTSALDTGILVS